MYWQVILDTRSIWYLRMTMNKYKWIIEKENICLVEGKDKFDTDNFISIYFTNGTDKIGLNNNQTFFINNKIFNFKLHATDIIPFQTKTARCNLSFGTEEIISYNIGFKNNIEYYEISIMENCIKFTARKEQFNKTFLLE